MATIDLTKYGITGVTEILHNPSYEFLFEEENKPELEGYDGSCFDTLNRTIDEAYALARLNYMNQVSKDDTKDMEYISMREKQADTLYDMYKHIRRIDTVPVTAEILSAFFEKTQAVQITKHRIRRTL